MACAIQLVALAKKHRSLTGLRRRRLESSGSPILGDSVTILRICEFMLSTSCVVGSMPLNVVYSKLYSRSSKRPVSAACCSSGRKAANTFCEKASTP